MDCALSCRWEILSFYMHPSCAVVSEDVTERQIEFLNWNIRYSDEHGYITSTLETGGRNRTFQIFFSQSRLFSPVGASSILSLIRGKLRILREGPMLILTRGKLRTSDVSSR